MAEIIGAVTGVTKTFLEINTISIDNWGFKLFYKWTTTLCVFSSVLVSGRQFFGEPIKCDAGAAGSGIENDVLETYCWMYSTFDIPPEYKGPCGGSKLNDLEVATDPYAEPLDVIVYNSYYQWVSIFLIALAILFYLPRILWLSLEGGLMKFFGKGTTTRFIEDQDEKRDKLVEFFRRNIHNKYNVYLVGFICCEVLNFFTVIVVFFLTNRFLHYRYLGYGFNVWQYYLLPPEEQRYDITGIKNPMCYTFPRIASCNYFRYGTGGKQENIAAICILALNIINDKELIAPKVLRQLKHSMTPCISNIKVDWGDGTTNNQQLFTTPVMETAETPKGNLNLEISVDADFLEGKAIHHMLLNSRIMILNNRIIGLWKKILNISHSIFGHLGMAWLLPTVASVDPIADFANIEMTLWENLKERCEPSMKFHLGGKCEINVTLTATVRSMVQSWAKIKGHLPDFNSHVALDLRGKINDSVTKQICIEDCLKYIPREVLFCAERDGDDELDLSLELIPAASECEDPGIQVPENSSNWLMPMIGVIPTAILLAILSRWIYLKWKQCTWEPIPLDDETSTGFLANLTSSVSSMFSRQPSYDSSTNECESMDLGAAPGCPAPRSAPRSAPRKRSKERSRGASRGGAPMDMDMDSAPGCPAPRFGAPPPVSDRQKLLDLSSLQVANGSFKREQVFVDISGKALDQIDEEAEKYGIDKAVWFTALVVALLENKFSKEKDSWDMIVDKAKKWITKSGADTVDVIQKAKLFLQ